MVAKKTTLLTPFEVLKFIYKLFLALRVITYLSALFVTLSGFPNYPVPSTRDFLVVDMT